MEEMVDLQTGSERLLQQDDPSNGKTAPTIDSLYQKLGRPGRLQVILAIFLALNYATVSSNALAGVFFGYTPSHHCNRDVGWSDFANGTNRDKFLSSISSDTIYNTSLVPNLTPVTGSSLERANSVLTVKIISRHSCSVKYTLEDPVAGTESKNVTESCESGPWIYDIEPTEVSSVTEFDLVCDYAFLNNMANSLYYLGVMLGGFICGYLSDSHGRKPVVTVTLLLTLAVGVALHFANSFPLFVVLRVAMGALTQGLATSSYVLTIELFAMQYRSVAGTTIQLMWAGGVMYLAMAAWLAKHWRYIQLVLLAPTLISALTIWFQQESLRWLLTGGKTQQASQVIKRFTSFNNLPNPVGKDHQQLLVFKAERKHNKASYLTLIKTPVLRKRTLAMGFIWFAANVGYYGMNFYTPKLAGNRYLNFLLSGITETVVYAIEIWAIIRFGRKRPLICSFIIGAVSCVIAGVIPRNEAGETGEAEGIVIIIFSVVGRCVMGAMFIVTEIFAVELFPTTVRNMSVGVCVFMARLGAGIVPQIFLLSTVTFAQLPPLLFAAVSVVGALLTCYMPETKGKQLPETVQEIEIPRKSKGALSRDGSAPEATLQEKEQNLINLDQNGATEQKSPV